MVSDLNILVWKWFKIAALILPYKTCWKPRFPMDERPLVEGYIANFGISLDVFEFWHFVWFFPFFKKFGILAILGPSYCGIGATIRISREMLCLPYVGFFLNHHFWLHLLKLTFNKTNRLKTTKYKKKIYI